MITLFLIGWVLCALAALGFWVGFFDSPADSHDDYRETLGFGALLALIGGPAALVGFFFLSGFGCRGWRLNKAWAVKR